MRTRTRLVGLALSALLMFPNAATANHRDR